MTTDPLFRMTVEDVFSIKGRGTVATGKIESGTLHVGDKIQITRPDGGIGKTAVVTGLEMFRKTAREAAAGDNVGVLFKDIAKSDLQRGDILGADQGADQGMDFTWKP
jgi:elongation factor Tu